MDKLLCVCGRIGVVLLVGAHCVVFREQASGADHTHGTSHGCALGIWACGLPEWPFVNRPGVPALLFLHGIYRH